MSTSAVKHKLIKNKSLVQLAGHQSRKIGEDEIPCFVSVQKDKTKILKLIEHPPKGQLEFVFYRHTKLFMEQEGFGQVLSEIDLTRNSADKSSIKSEKSKDDLSDSGISDQSENISKISAVSHQLPDKTSPETSNSTSNKPKILEKNLFSELNLSKSMIKELITEYIPKFYGIQQINGNDYLELENLGYAFTSSCMADVKIGRVTYDPTADEQKKLRREKKWPPLKEVGYQFLGVKRDDEDQLDRKYFRSLSKENYKSIYEKFLPEISKEKFSNDQNLNQQNKRKLIIQQWVQKLEKIIGWFKNQSSIQFYASSLLVGYCSVTCQTCIKMIDFAHVFYEDGKKDENYIYGIEKFRDDLKEFL